MATDSVTLAIGLLAELPDRVFLLQSGDTWPHGDVMRGQGRGVPYNPDQNAGQRGPGRRHTFEYYRRQRNHRHVTNLTVSHSLTDPHSLVYSLACTTCKAYLPTFRW
jgi:hypothetical protein